MHEPVGTRRVAVWRVVGRALLPVVWLLSVTWWWREYVPAVPILEVPVQEDSEYLGTTAAGHLVLRKVSSDRRKRWTLLGPLEVRDARTGRRLHSVLGDADRVLTQPRDDDYVAARSGQQLQVVNLAEGTTAFTLTAVSDHPQIAFSDDDQTLSVVDGQVLSLYQLPDGELRWQTPIVDLFRQRLPDGDAPVFDRTSVRLLRSKLLHLVTQVGGAILTVWVDAATGRLRPDLPEVLFAEVSADGRWLSTWGGFGNGHILYETRNGGIVRELAEEMNGVMFSRDGQELIQLRGDGAWRWAIETGARLDNHNTVSGSASGLQSREGRLAVIEVFDWGGMPKWMDAWPGPLTRLVERAFPGPHSDVFVIDLVSGRRQRVLTNIPRHPMASDPANDVFQLIDLAAGERFAVLQRGGILVYDYPPARNWWWLATWGFAPVLLFEFVRRVYAARRNRSS